MSQYYLIACALSILLNFTEFTRNTLCAHGFHIKLTTHSHAVFSVVIWPLHYLPVHLLHIPINFHTHRQIVDEYTKLELDQQSRISRIRRDTQAFDEELARQAAMIDHSRSIA